MSSSVTFSYDKIGGKMKKRTKIVLSIVIFLIAVVFTGYKLYQYKMTAVLFSIDRIVLLENNSESRNIEIKVDSQVEKVFKKAKYSGNLAISKESYYKGKCYFNDGITGTIIVYRKSGDIRIIVGDAVRCFTFKDVYGEEWLKLIESKRVSYL